MANNSKNLMKNINPHIQKFNEVHVGKTKQLTASHIIVKRKYLKVKFCNLTVPKKHYMAKH